LGEDFRLILLVFLTDRSGLRTIFIKMPSQFCHCSIALIRAVERAFWKQVGCAALSDMVSVIRISDDLVTNTADKFQLFKLVVEMTVELFGNTFLNSWSST
jgi:hypothetical protein